MYILLLSPACYSFGAASYDVCYISYSYILLVILLQYFVYSIFKFDFCQWSKPWRKRIRFLSFFMDLSAAERRCTSGNGICTRTGKPHMILCGRQDGRFLTSIAEPYPSRLCSKLCVCVSRMPLPTKEPSLCIIRPVRPAVYLATRALPGVW